MQSQSATMQISTQTTLSNNETPKKEKKPLSERYER